MKLTQGVNFINIFRSHFSYETSFQQLFSSYVLALAKNSYKKCARKTLMKLTTGVNFINVKRANFSYERWFRQLF